MNTSELIKKLQEIDASVPFDADVVIGDDWMPNAVTGVYHEPPYTFLTIADDTDDEEIEEDHELAKEMAEKYEQSRKAFLTSIFSSVQTGELSIDEATTKMQMLMDGMVENSDLSYQYVCEVLLSDQYGN
ncbi:hypothetical protein [Photobacterium leiognathi]|uniref:hypothetical protein n=1 Tax=Photobacterium leiognathi TaxID=553611 RepID=UPI002981DA7B|nr:hypothetical protein [Photobacterium leiognathi]